MLHLESELESFAPSTIFLTKLCWKWVFLLSLMEGDDEYAIISAASMSDSVDDTTQYLDDSWWRDCLTMYRMFSTFTHGPAQSRVRSTFLCSGEIATTMLQIASFMILQSGRIIGKSIPCFYVWWSMFGRPHKVWRFMIWDDLYCYHGNDAVRRLHGW